MLRGFGLLPLAALVAPPVATAAHAQSAPRWIASWGTSQQLGSPPPPIALRTPPKAAAAPTAAPAAAPSPMVPYPTTLADQSIRMVVRTSAGGNRFRLHFSNASNGPAVTFGAVHAALSAQGGAIVAASERTVTFAGQPRLTLQPGASVESDPVALPVAPLSEVAVSLYLPHATPTNTVHPLGLSPAYITSGNTTAATALDHPVAARSYFWLSGLSVPAARGAGTIVALGDSITDGYATTPGAHREWLALLAGRLQGDPATAGWGVVNAGISGNRVLKPGFGVPAVARFDADVLARPGARWVLLLEGINDINMTIMPIMPATQHVSATQMILGYRQIITRAHAHGLKIAGATIMPTKGLPFWSAQGEQMRQTVNAWIRADHHFDAVLDFDAATRDPADPQRLRADFDCGDHVHPNDAGNHAMASAIDLRIFKSDPTAHT